MIGFYNYTVILTYISLISSFIGITQLFHDNFTIAVFCLIFSGFCDMFDGCIARCHKNRSVQAKTFGIQIDSLCDLVCFGILPAVFNYKYTMYLNADMSVIALVISISFSLAALIRLGYFNVMEQERQQQTSGFREYYQGLPVTSIAAFLPGVYIFRNLLGNIFPYLFNVFMFIVAFLFIYNFKMKKPHGTALAYMTAAGVTMVVILLLQTFNVINF